MYTPTELAQMQLDAYNNGDIKNFMAVYHEDVLVREFPTQKIMYKGIKEMEDRYAELFRTNPNQHAKLLSRVVKGNIVIDHEHVTGRTNGVEVEAVAMYEVSETHIINVWFIK
ncbi:nuclear transport factor 2 family protein [Bacillus salitolerans]|uniref:Nuclear transport factor 2 family protein n=1 Tax=Bacillus salitolerans TaxID=1437434 RepID=A0ABW4LSY6_9BACI